VVWPESKQIGLIDSIFRNFYVPPVIFAVQEDDDGETTRVCVDGKQRLTSIQKFLDGLVRNTEHHFSAFLLTITEYNRYLVSPRLWVSYLRAEGELHQDRDTRTKKSFWFVRSDAQKTTRLEIPESWKRRFAETRITCGQFHCH
jgi:uncharacterized protein with ParB-like and HNH nuclease domain